jgi:predicted O-linked N-acetylglucosamine transferase (SPINDLY family)
MGWEDKLTSALAHHQEGRLAPAIELYRKVLAEQPEQPDANHLYGLALDGEGDTAVGLAHVEKAVALEPGHPVYLSNLGYLLGKLGRGEDAERACRASIAADGTDADAHNNLGLALEVQDRLDDAAAAYVAALATEPRHMNAMMNRGDVLRRMGRTEDALGWFEAARAIDPRHPPANLNLASLLVEEGRAAEAEPLARELVAMVPGYAKAHNALGAALKGLKDYAGAEAAFRQAAAIEPEYLKFTVNLAGTLAEQKKYEEAESLFEQVLRTEPDLATAHAGLGKLYIDVRKYAAANTHLVRAVELDPDSFSGHALLGLARLHHADIVGAVAAFEVSHAIQPFNDWVTSNYLFFMAFHPGYDSARHYQLSTDWARGAAKNIIALPPAAPPNKGRRTRVGFLAYEFYDHNTSNFFEPVIQCFGDDLELFGYAGNERQDATTERLKGYFSGWRDVSGLDAGEIAASVRADGIDILVLVSSYLAIHRLPMFYRAAPVQVAYLNLATTTGTDTVDYLITEEGTDPSGEADQYYTEKLVRISHRDCYRTPEGAGEVQPSPLQNTGAVTFASFNNVGKITPDIMAAWVRILTSVEGSRMLIRNSLYFDASKDWNPVRDKLLEAGIDAAQFEFLPFADTRADAIRTYNQVDIALDTYPCNGGTTTCDALWMGVPVVSVRGPNFIGRQTATYLAKVGLADLVANSIEDYEARAVALAAAPARLAEIRRTLRPLVAEHMFDYQSHADEMQAAFKEMWRRHLAGEKPAAFRVPL